MSSNTCTYILKKGKNKGESCSLKCFNNTQLCKKHSIDTIDEVTVNSQISNQNSSLQQSDTEEKENKPKEKKDSKEKKEKKEPKEPKEKNKQKEPKEKKEPKEPKEIKQVSEKLNVFNKQKIQAKRNSYDNYVLSNDLVVHPVNKNIIGRQQGDKIIELSIEDIEYCKEHGFRYLQPSVMYFADSEIEKKEIELHKIMMKSQNKNNENSEDDLEEEVEEEDEEEDEEN